MPYLSKESVKQRRNAIKKAFPKYKFSITGSHSSGINIDVMSGPIELGKYEQINHYYIMDHFKDEPKKADFLQSVYEIANNSNGTEVYDGDYGRVPNFYVHLSVGKWDKPYVVTN